MQVGACRPAASKAQSRPCHSIWALFTVLPTDSGGPLPTPPWEGWARIGQAPHPGQEQKRAPSRGLMFFEWRYPPCPARPGCAGLLVPCLFVMTITTLFSSTDDSGDDDEAANPADKSELHHTLKNLSLKLDDLSTCNDLIAKHGAALQRSLTELDGLKIPSESGEKLKVVNERATLFRITSNAMINVSTHPHRPGTGLPGSSPGVPQWVTRVSLKGQRSISCSSTVFPKASAPQLASEFSNHLLHSAVVGQGHSS